MNDTRTSVGSTRSRSARPPAMPPSTTRVGLRKSPSPRKPPGRSPAGCCALPGGTPARRAPGVSMCCAPLMGCSRASGRWLAPEGRSSPRAMFAHRPTETHRGNPRASRTDLRVFRGSIPMVSRAARADHRAMSHEDHRQEEPMDATTQVPPGPLPPPGPGSYRPPLVRSRSNRIVAGVAGGLGYHLGVDPVLIRIAFALLAFAGGLGILLYLIARGLIPGEGAQASVGDGLVGRGPRSPPRVPIVLFAISRLCPL